MVRLLTLAMTEIKPGEGTYKLIALWIKQKEIITLDIEESKFIDINGDPVWDIFGITQVEDIEEKSKKNFIVVGDSYLERYENKDKIKEIFDDKKMRLSTFIRNKSEEYCILKARHIYDIKNMYEKNKNNKIIFSSRATISDGGKEEKNIKIKDYRWLKYWKAIIDKNVENEENLEDVYEGFLCEKEIYLILFRYKVYAYDIYWIAGVHYF